MSQFAHETETWLQLQGGDIHVAVLDASNLPANPSWPLRNMLLLAAARWAVTELTVICWRSRAGRLSAQLSLELKVMLPPMPRGGLLKIDGRTGRTDLAELTLAC